MSAYDYRDDYREDSRAYDADAARARLAARQARAGRAVDDGRSSRSRSGGARRSGGYNRGPQRGGNDDLLATWLPRIGIVVAAIVVIVILVNLVQCVGGAISGGQAEAPAETTATETAEGTESSSSAAAEASTEGVESPWTENGRFSTGDSELDNYIKKVCDEHSTEGASFDKNAYETNIYISRTDYVERENNQSPWGEGWDVEYAKQYFQEGNSGNCYNYCAVTEYVLKYFGYSDAEAEPCVVHLESGNWGDHGLVFVTNKVDNKRCLVDDALSADGWMLDIDAYEYDVRNINQNTSIKGNVDAIDDEPTKIQPGNLTE